MEEKKAQPKINYVEAIFAGFFLFVLPDMIEMTFIGDFFFLTDIFFFPASQLYLYLKGVRFNYVLIGNILEFIPIVGLLPIRTTTFSITVWMEHHPKIKQAAEIAYAVKAVSKTQTSQVQNSNSSNLENERLTKENNLSSNLKNEAAISKNLNTDYNNIVENYFSPEIDNEKKII